jgi:hypothetical protein
LGNEITGNEICRTCGTYGKQERYIQTLMGGDLRERDCLEDIVIVGRIILKFMKWVGETD